MIEQNERERYDKLVEKMQKVAKNITNNFQLDFIYPQMKEMLDSMANLSIFSISEEVSTFIVEAKTSENLSHEEFLDEYGEEIDICKAVGRAGWVVSEHSNPRKIKEWYQLVVQGKESQIIDYFDASNSQILKDIRNHLSKCYIVPPKCRYYSKGIDAYDKEDYMTAAMYLVALLESRIGDYMDYPQKTPNSKKYSDEGFKQHLNQEFLKINSFITKRFLFLNMYPSLIEYLKRLFVDGIYNFKNNIEPPYVNRNWLLHGKCVRDIERFECVQILNALSVVEFVFKMV